MASLAPILAVDPGAVGAAVLVSADGDILAVGRWRRHEKAKRRTTTLRWVCGGRAPASGTLRGISTDHQLGIALANLVIWAGRFRLFVEAAVVGANPGTAIVSSRRAGAMAGALEERAVMDPTPSVEWVRASDWRLHFGIKPGAKRDAALAATRERMSPRLLSGLVDLGIEDGDDLLAACGIAAWAWSRDGAAWAIRGDRGPG